MAGVIIDTELKGTSKADNDLRALNSRLADLVKTSSRVNLNTSIDMRNASKSINELGQLSSAYKKTEQAGVSSFRNTSAAAKDTTGILSSLKGAVISLGATFLAFKGAGYLNETSDDLVMIQNRLKLVSSGMDEVIRKQSTLFRLSNETRSSFSDTASMFTDFSKSLERVGTSETKIMKVV